MGIGPARQIEQNRAFFNAAITWHKREESALGETKQDRFKISHGKSHILSPAHFLTAY